MLELNIKPTYKPIKTYYAELERYTQLGEQNEGTVRAAFQNLLQHYCHQPEGFPEVHQDFGYYIAKLTLLCEKSHYTPEQDR